MEFLNENNFNTPELRINRFFKFCTKILDFYNISSTLCKDISKCSSKQHRKALDKLLDDNSEEIFEGYKSVEWLQNEAFLSYKFEGKEKFRLNLSQIYSLSCKYSSETKKRLDKYQSISDDKLCDLQYPKIFLFLLYSYFEIFSSPSNRKDFRRISLEVKRYIKSYGKEEPQQDMGPTPDIGKMIGSVFDIVKSDKRIGKHVKSSNIPIDNLIKGVSDSLNKNSKNMSDMSGMGNIVRDILKVVPLPEDDESDGKKEEGDKVGNEVTKVDEIEYHDGKKEVGEAKVGEGKVTETEAEVFEI